MPSEARLKKYRKIKEGPIKLKFGASKTGVRGGARAPGAPPLDPHLVINLKRCERKLVLLNLDLSHD